MKLAEHLLVGKTEYRVISRDVSLALSAAGKARFKVKADAQPSGLVLFRCGYAKHAMHDFFMGYIDKAHQDGGAWVLQCQELINGLQQSCPISLRQCLIADVLRDVAKTTLVQFAATDSGSQRPRFASHANGWHTLRMIPQVFGLADFEFWQQTDGQVWLGTWGSAATEYTTDRKIDPRFFSKQAADSAVLPALPVLRPGMLVNGRRIRTIRLTQKHETLIQWKS